MIDKEYGHRLVDKLVELTCDKKIVWMTLPRYFETNDNEPLRKAVIANNKYAYSPIESQNIFLINEYESYCTIINGGIIGLLYKTRGKEKMLDIVIQVDPTQRLQNIHSDDELQKKLEELLFKISTEADDGLKFIDGILNL